MLLLKVALVALACAAQESKPPTEVPFLKRAMEAQDFISKIQEMLGKVKDHIEELQKEVEGIFSNAYDKLHSMVQDWSDKWYEAVNTAVTTAQSYNVDVSECLTNNITLAGIVDKLAEETHTCISDQYPQMDRIKDQLAKVVELEKEVVEKAKDAFRQCEGKPMLEVVGCEISALSPIAAEIGELVSTAGSTATELGSTLVESGSEIRECIKESSTSNAEKAKEVMNKTVTCIKSKLPQMTSASPDSTADASHNDVNVSTSSEASSSPASTSAGSEKLSGMAF